MRNEMRIKNAQQILSVCKQVQIAPCNLGINYFQHLVQCFWSLCVAKLIKSKI